MSRDYAAFDNFLSCVALIDESTPLPLRSGVDFPVALDGIRGRTAIGMTADGRLILFCSQDGTVDAKSMVCIVGAAPIAAAGFFHYNGLTLEKFLWAWFKSEFLMAGNRVWKSENYYLKAAQLEVKKRK